MVIFSKCVLETVFCIRKQFTDNFIYGKLCILSREFYEAESEYAEENAYGYNGAAYPIFKSDCTNFVSRILERGGVAQHINNYLAWASSSENGWDNISSDGGTYARIRR